MSVKHTDIQQMKNKSELRFVETPQQTSNHRLTSCAHLDRYNNC